MRVLGIDPGSTCTGYGVIDCLDSKLHHIDNGGISPKSGAPLAQRLYFIYSELSALIEKFRPETIVVENLFVAKNARSSLLLGHARGVALLAASSARLEIGEYTPAEVKKAIVGSGNATKFQVQQMVRAILGLPEIALEDASDALAVAICHCNSYKMRRIMKS